MDGENKRFTAAPVTWSTKEIIEKRDRYYAASQSAFVPYEKPLILKRGEMQYVWDEQGNKLIDLLGMNLCVSVGHAHPAIVHAVQEQVAQLTIARRCFTIQFRHILPKNWSPLCPKRTIGSFILLIQGQKQSIWR